MTGVPWQVGRVYDYFGTPIVCRGRFFEGPLELVELAFVVAAPEQPVPFIRTARTLAQCVFPRVTATLGGVTRPDACQHDLYPSLLADAGPHAGLRCCSGCGRALDFDR